jgi:hypothetical protein
MNKLVYKTLVVAGFTLGGCAMFDDLAYVNSSRSETTQGTMLYRTSMQYEDGKISQYRLVSKFGPDGKIVQKGKKLCGQSDGKRLSVSVYAASSAFDKTELPPAIICQNLTTSYNRSLKSLYPWIGFVQIDHILVDENALYKQPWQRYTGSESFKFEVLTVSSRLKNPEDAISEITLMHELFHVKRAIVENRSGELKPVRDRMYEEIAAVLNQYCANLHIRGEIQLSRKYSWFNPYLFEKYFPETPYEVVMRLTREDAKPREKGRGHLLGSYTLSHLYVGFKYLSDKDKEAAKANLLDECHAVQNDMTVMARNLEEFFTQNDINWDYIRVKNGK